MSNVEKGQAVTRVLIVEDEKSIRDTLGELLRDAGYSVALAQDAQEARQRLQTTAFDVVVTDIILPRVTGLELLRAIRQASPRVQVVLMTGEPTVETAAEALRAGAFDYLFKPVGKHAILRAVGNAARMKTVDDERDKLAEANRRYQDALEQMVEERTRSLLKAVGELKRSQENAVKPEGKDSLSQVMVGIAHDFNNALMPIMGLSDHLLSKPERLEDRPAVTAALKSIRAAACAARGIVLRLRELCCSGDLQERRPAPPANAQTSAMAPLAAPPPGAGGGQPPSAPAAS